MFTCPAGYSDSSARLPIGDDSGPVVNNILVEVQDILNISKSVGKQLDSLIDSGRRDVSDFDDDKTTDKEFTSKCAPVYKYLVRDLSGTQRFMILLDVFESHLPQPGAVLALRNAPLSHGVLLCNSTHYSQLVPGKRPTKDQMIARLELQQQATSDDP